VISFIHWSQATFQNSDFIVAGKSIGALKRNVIKPLLQIITSWGWPYNYNRSENFIEIGSNTYYLFGANNEASQDVLQGLTAAGALADEIVLFPRSFVEQMIGRCSVEGSKIFCNCNPDNPYHYFKTDYIDKAKEKKILYYQFQIDDNLTLSEKVKDRYKRMFSGVFYKRYVKGLWVIAEGIIYDMFDEKKHVADCTRMKFDEFYISCDYGTYNALSFGLWGHNPNDDIWYKYSNYYYSGKDKGVQKDDSQYYDELEKFTETNITENRFIGEIPAELNSESEKSNYLIEKYLYGIIIDPSASSFISYIKNRYKYDIIKAKNDVLEGIRNMSTALSTNLIKFDKSCVDSIREFYSYKWDDKAAERGEDLPIKQFDHTKDEERYFINTILLPVRETRLLL
jgi:PBSX family phage terminase large subunit